MLLAHCLERAIRDKIPHATKTHQVSKEKNDCGRTRASSVLFGASLRNRTNIDTNSHSSKQAVHSCSFGLASVLLFRLNPLWDCRASPVQWIECYAPWSRRVREKRCRETRFERVFTRGCEPRRDCMTGRGPGGVRSLAKEADIGGCSV